MIPRYTARLLCIEQSALHAYEIHVIDPIHVHFMTSILALEHMEIQYSSILCGFGGYPNSILCPPFQSSDCRLPTINYLSPTP